MFGMVVAMLTAWCSADVPTRQDLGGGWRLRASGTIDSIAATVPGCVHTDLLAAGRIADPFIGENAASLRWVSDTKWTYSRSFTPAAEMLARRRVMLRCEGLDTIATVTLNGRKLGEADNMFRTWTFDAKPLLRDGDNQLEVTFTPPKDYIAGFIAAAKGSGPNTAYSGFSNIRKALYSNGWDFAPSLPTAGIYRPISLIGYDEVRLQDVLIDTTVRPGAEATVAVRACLSNESHAGLQLRATVTLDGKPIAAATGHVNDSVVVPISNPQLWWPNGMGNRPFYTVRVDLLDSADQVLDSADRRFGLRNIELLRPADGKPLRLRVNGRDMFCRGANWVPADMFLPRVTNAHLRDLLKQVAAANMNMLRTWGGGAYEDDAFYDVCDELGLLVWHDFKFACNGYPGRNVEFAENVREEVRQQVTRLSPHPSMAVWCGNNEVEAIVRNYGLMSRADYDLFFRDLIGGELKKLLPQASYVAGSPGEGDEHNWWVWHIGAAFEKYRESHGWMTEFGFESFPVPATIDSFTTPRDRTSVFSPVMKAHQHNGNGRGNEMIVDQIARYFRPAKDFESALWLSQINQAYGLRMGIEHWRADWPKSSGALVWQLNDCQPGPTWSMVDYFARPKAAMFLVRNAYAPVLLTGVYDEKSDTLPLTICSDLITTFSADLRWQAFDSSGQLLGCGKADVEVPAGTTAVVGPVVDLKAVVVKTGHRDLIVRAYLFRDGREIAKNTFLAVRPKELPLHDPMLVTEVTAADDGFDIVLSAKKPALYAWLNVTGDPDARFSDNFVHVTADHAERIHVTLSKSMDINALKKVLTVRSLYDTYNPPTQTENAADIQNTGTP